VLRYWFDFIHFVSTVPESVDVWGNLSNVIGCYLLIYIEDLGHLPTIT
jgi:hypothetical protein